MEPLSVFWIGLFTTSIIYNITNYFKFRHEMYYKYEKRICDIEDDKLKLLQS